MSKTRLAWEDVELNLLTLSFPKEFEAYFKEEHFKKSLRHVRIALLLSIFFFGIFGFLDAWIVPEAKYQLWFIGLFGVGHPHWSSSWIVRRIFWGGNI